MRQIARILAFFVLSPMWLHAAGVLSTIRQIRSLTPAQVSQSLPVQIEGVVTFYSPADHILFVEDKTGAIFINNTARAFPFVQGDRIQVRGVTAGSYHAIVVGRDMRKIGVAPLPKPSPATFPLLMSGTRDCAYTTVTGTIRSATEQQTGVAPFLLLEVQMDGGYVHAYVQNVGALDPGKLLDARVRLTGVSGGRFDGKFQLVGANFYLSSPSQVRILAPASTNPATLPLTPIGQVMGSYNVLERSPRVRVRGSVTLYDPGSRLVMEDAAGRAILVHTHQRVPLRIGEVVDATGFADPNDYTQSLDHGQFQSTGKFSPVRPHPATWSEAVSGRYAFNLISLEGRLIEQVHETHQATLFINSGSHVFSVVLRHPGGPVPGLPYYPMGSLVRISGVCFVGNGGPWSGATEFELHLRNAGDVAILARPSWLTVSHMLYVIGALGVVVFAALFWVVMLRRRVHQQTRMLRRTLEEEAARDRRQAFFEKERSRVLEAINSLLPLEQVLRMVAHLISEQMDGLECWCELAAGGIAGSADGERPPEKNSPNQSRRDILSGSGERLGEMILAWSAEEEHRSVRPEMLDTGVSLAALAIDNRRLYEGLIHRSEYDQLTEVPNRFLFELRLKDVFADARRNKRSFALIYIDLDRFKSVNDRHGHRIGDVYLQHVVRRLQEKLRSRDTLARVGGDEFIVLVPVVQDRGEAEDIAARLSKCFESPFRIDGKTLEGSASIGVALYPEDGVDEDQLQRFADSAMYASKQRTAD